MNKKNVKYSIIIFIIFLMLILLVLLNSVINMYSTEEKKNNNEIDENIIINDFELNNDTIADEFPEGNIWEDENEITEDDWNLYKESDQYTYFLIKQCINKYYSSKIIEEKLIDNDVKSLLNLEQDINNIYGKIENPNFNIDKIYRADIRVSKDIYLVYYRIQKDNVSCLKSAMAIKVDVKNYTFSIYPYEYLKEKGYLNLGENDKIILDNIEDMEENAFNRYRVDEIKTNDKAYANELFERLRFDINYDLDHLYNILNEEYKNEKFKTKEEFINYINKNKKEFDTEQLLSFNVNNYIDYKQYIISGKNEVEYIFNFYNPLDYSIVIN